MRKFAFETWRGSRQSPRFLRGEAINVTKRPVAVSLTWIHSAPAMSPIRPRLTFWTLFSPFYTQWPSATNPSVSGSSGFLIADQRSKWHRIAVGSRISEFLFGSSGSVSHVPGSTTSPILRVRPLGSVGCRCGTRTNRRPLDDRKWNGRPRAWNHRMIALPEHRKGSRNVFLRICARRGTVFGPGHFSEGSGSKQRVTNAPGMRTLCASAATILKSSVHSVGKFCCGLNADSFREKASPYCWRSRSAAHVHAIGFPSQTSIDIS
jgi:hypothetical protein